MLIRFSSLSARTKLITIFIIIKVIPLLAIAVVAWHGYQALGRQISTEATDMAGDMRTTVREIGQRVTDDSIAALDERSRQAIERLTTDTARQLAGFLYERDDDIRLASRLPVDQTQYRAFLERRLRAVIDHGPWRLRDDGNGWEPIETNGGEAPVVEAQLPDNSRNFHSRPPERFGEIQRRPLYLEMSFVGLDGKERIKITTTPDLPAEPRDVSDTANTFSKAERYFAALRQLKPGEIYVSRVIGPYVGSPIIGPYTPEAAAKLGIDYAPTQAAYAGKENPVGKRFRGLVRWATPVTRDDEIIGYVTLALDHRHIMQFSNTLDPTEGRYTDIPDPGSGNYAFIWDFEGRSIAHPRAYFIVGYDPDTGQLAPPWLEKDMYRAWRASGQPIEPFLAGQPPYHQQSLDKAPDPEQKRLEQIALHCRYLNFAPQCAGWHNITRHGGSGSFVIYWSGLWKLTTAATIPYYTGQYGDTPRGFGWVTIGANVSEFHKPATETKAAIDQLVNQRDQALKHQLDHLLEMIRATLREMTLGLSLSTAAMTVLVILIAIWMAAYLTRRITQMVTGMKRFQDGDFRYRLTPRSRDELGDLERSFNTMADIVGDAMRRLKAEISERRRVQDDLQQAHDELEQRVHARTAELRKANEELRQLSITDPLTQAFNRRFFMERARSECARARRDGQVSLIMLDVDYFKEINDCHGHGVGDAALQRLAEAVQAQLRCYDVFARIGGEEFAVLQPDTGPDQAVAVAERLRTTIMATPVDTVDGAVYLTVSIGVAATGNGIESADQLMQTADKALYRAKRLGRNRVARADTDGG